MGEQTRTIILDTPYGPAAMFANDTLIKRFVETPMPGMEHLTHNEASEHGVAWVRELDYGRRLIWKTDWSSDWGVGLFGEKGIDVSALPEHYGMVAGGLWIEDEQPTGNWGPDTRCLIEVVIPEYASAEKTKIEQMAISLADIAYRDVVAPYLNGVDIVEYAFSTDAGN